MMMSLPTLQSMLNGYADGWRTRRLRSLFDLAPDRATEFTIEAAGLTLDYSKNHINVQIRDALLELAAASGLGAKVEGLFTGAMLNPTEQRAVLHTALRAAPGEAPAAVANEVAAVKQRMRELVTALHTGQWRGHTGLAITDVVNIGIGGSHLGPQLACAALRDSHVPQTQVHFVSNVDGGDIASHLARLDPARTLFIVASKSFTTPETALNARTAERWLQARLGDPAANARHFIAITAHPDRAVKFGIARENVLPMWDWVGGRYSLWSAIGLPIALAVGMDSFEAMLAGAANMDRHFRSAPFATNLPVLLALVGIWNTNYLGAETLAVVPYDERLFYLPSYLQQLEMESNGKRVLESNMLVSGHTAPILWGGLGTNVQHAFFQLLHQGTRLIPVDFVLALQNPHSPSGHHDMLIANCLAQAEALMCGRTREEAAATSANVPGIDLPLHRATAGNQPSNMLVMEALTPATFGALLALYEHKTFVQGVIWGINSFDQWGVELGKELAQSLLNEIETAQVGFHDSSTTALLQRYLRAKQSVE